MEALLCNWSLIMIKKKKSIYNIYNSIEVELVLVTITWTNLIIQCCAIQLHACNQYLNIYCIYTVCPANMSLHIFNILNALCVIHLSFIVILPVFILTANITYKLTICRFCLLKIAISCS